MQLQPYLFFEGRTEEAAEFYRQTIGAKIVMMMRFKESPSPHGTPVGGEEKIMHMTMRIGESTIMASDGRCSGSQKFDGFALSLTPKTDAEAQKLFDALAEGGQVQMPLGKTFFASSFGMLADRFGVMWMIHVAP